MDINDYYNLKIMQLLNAFKKNKINIDNITIDKAKNEDYYIIDFWYNKKLVEYSYKMNYKDIEHYFNGILLIYSYEFNANNKGV